jgi:O-antigen ligase
MLLNNPQTIRLVGEWYFTASGRQRLSTGSIRENLFSGVVMLISEIGFIGLVLYMAFLIYPLIYIMKNVKCSPEVSPQRQFLIGFVVMLLLTNLIVGIVWDIWRVRMLSIGIWLLLGRIWDTDDVNSDCLDD